MAEGGPLEGACRITNIHVVDGDSLECNLHGRRVRARLFGVDAPELGQREGPACAERFRNLVDRAGGLMAEVIDIDQYDRAVVLLYPAGGDRRDSLNLRLVREGYAYAFTRFGGGELGFNVAERDAREARRGILWERGREGGERPWDYRLRQNEGWGWQDALKWALFAVIILIGLLLALLFFDPPI